MTITHGVDEIMFFFYGLKHFLQNVAGAVTESQNKRLHTELCAVCPLFMNQILSGNHSCFLVSHSCSSRAYDATDLTWFVVSPLRFIPLSFPF